MRDTNDRERCKGEVRLTGVGLLVFTVLIILVLFRFLGPDEHPLALQRNVNLCEALGPDVWNVLEVPYGAASPKPSPGNPENLSICELIPVGRPAGPGAPEPLARVMLTTEADLRYQNLGQSLGRYMNDFVAEMKASGWETLEVKGPWRRTHAFAGPTGETVLLLEDEGVVLWISSFEFALDRLLMLAEAVTGRLRSAS